jgi:hypothetical protein
MHRLLPNPPPLSGVRRQLGALPHGMPTAVTFSVSVAGIAVTSLLVVEAAMPGRIGPVVDSFLGTPGAEAQAERARVPGAPSSPPSRASEPTPIPQVAVVLVMEPGSQVPDAAATDGTGSPRPDATHRASVPGDEAGDPESAHRSDDDDQHADGQETAAPTTTTDGEPAPDGDVELDGSWSWTWSEPVKTAAPVGDEEDRPTPTPTPSLEPHDD